MTYTHIFDPDRPAHQRARKSRGGAIGAGDRRDGRVYVYDEKIILAVNVAMASRRPLLVRGPSGIGKSSLARNVQQVLGWRFYERVITSRTPAQDLLWEVDHLRRLRDAQIPVGEDGQRRSLGLEAYVKPGVLWWAFNRVSAAAQARRAAEPTNGRSRKPREHDPNKGDEHVRAVVLLDEIDKADPDVPNNLLVPLGSLEFQVSDTGEVVKAKSARAPLVIITSNDERELPAAFLRRCVELVIALPEDPEQLVERLAQIGKRHFPRARRSDLEKIAVLLRDALDGGVPGPAEYLDTVRACAELKVRPGADSWNDLVSMTFAKPSRAEQTPTTAAL